MLKSTDSANKPSGGDSPVQSTARLLAEFRLMQSRVAPFINNEFPPDNDGNKVFSSEELIRKFREFQERRMELESKWKDLLADVERALATGNKTPR